MRALSIVILIFITVLMRTSTCCNTYRAAV